MPNTPFTSGTYEATREGKHGPIRIAVSVDETSITDIRVLENHENEHYAGVALRYLPQKIVATQNVNIDVVSGATLTSRALLDATADALDQAGGSADELTPRTNGLNVPQHMVPGTYTAEALGRWAPGTIDGERFGVFDPQLIEVEVTVDETDITDVTVSRCTDNDHFAAPVLQRVAPGIIDEQSIFVDVVTGSTLTSAAVIHATADCLEQAGANMTGFLRTKPRVDADESLECDVCIIGAGHSGTVAAIMAQEAGARVIILEKGGRIGGRGFCPSGVAAAGAQIMKDAGITLTADDLYNQLYAQSGGRANNLLVRAICEDSGPMIDWLIEHGFEGTPPRPGVKWDEAFCCDFGRGQKKIQALYDNYIYPMGGIVLTETSATDLVMNDGKVCGVKARKQDGTRVHVTCKAAVVSTGGFGGSPELLQRLCHSRNFYDRGLTTQCSGDGILMCERAGAQLGPEIMPHMQEYLANPACNFTDNAIKYITYAGFLTVNLEGKRFMNECLNVEDAMGSGTASLRVQGGSYYYVIDQNQVDRMKEGGVGDFFGGHLNDYLKNSVIDFSQVPIPHIQEGLDDAITKGQAWKAGNIEDLAAAVGFEDPQIFIDTFNRYNELCRKGVDEDFGKIPQMMNEHTFPCYVVRSEIPIMGTLGGVKVNERLQALSLKDEAIPGLYVAGQEGSGFYTYPYYSTRCVTTTYAYCSGRLAGKHAAEYALGK